MNGFDKMNKKLLASQVEDALMDDILNKPVPIGEKIPNEYELAEMYGVGRRTIRETVKSLVSKGILEVRQGSGTYVIGTDTLENDPLGFSKYEDKYKLALELFEVRLMLEPEIAALAAQKATEQDKEEIVRLCDEVENFYRAGKNHTKKDQAFHAAIAKASGNSGRVTDADNSHGDYYIRQSDLSQADGRNNPDTQGGYGSNCAGRFSRRKMCHDYAPDL